MVETTDFKRTPRNKFFDPCNRWLPLTDKDKNNPPLTYEDKLAIKTSVPHGKKRRIMMKSHRSR